MKTILILILAMTVGFLLLSVVGCDSSSVRTPSGWKVDLNRLLTDRSFDEVQVKVDPNGAASFTMKKYKSEGQQVSEILKGIVAGGAVGAGI
jgi:hypothetical protein